MSAWLEQFLVRYAVAVLGYTPAYPIANILLTTWGTIIVLVVAN